MFEPRRTQIPAATVRSIGYVTRQYAFEPLGVDFYPQSVSVEAISYRAAYF